MIKYFFGFDIINDERKIQKALKGLRKKYKTSSKTNKENSKCK